MLYLESITPGCRVWRRNGCHCYGAGMVSPSKHVSWAQVVLAVDDSRSMQENGCGAFALEAVTLLTRALTRLDVGQVGVLRFGGTDHVRPLHNLERPFTDAAGPGILANLRFDQVN